MVRANVDQTQTLCPVAVLTPVILTAPLGAISISILQEQKEAYYV